jgi:hypothetical protein
LCRLQLHRNQHQNVFTYVTEPTRTRLQPGQFEDAEGNVIYEYDCPKEGLSIGIFELIADEKSIQAGNLPETYLLSTDTYILGKYRKPQIKLRRDFKTSIYI